MIQRIVGIINKRITVGVDRSNGNIFVHSSSNCITFTTDEMECLIAILTILHNFPLEQVEHVLQKGGIKLWEPKTPIAEITVD